MAAHCDFRAALLDTIKTKTMETYSSLQPINVMYFWLNYCDENHIERIPIAVKNIDRRFHMASEII